MKIDIDFSKRFLQVFIIFWFSNILLGIIILIYVHSFAFIISALFNIISIPSIILIVLISIVKRSALEEGKDAYKIVIITTVLQWIIALLASMLNLIINGENSVTGNLIFDFFYIYFLLLIFSGIFDVVIHLILIFDWLDL